MKRCLTTWMLGVMCVALVPAPAEAKRKRKRAPCSKVLRKYNALLKKATSLRDKARAQETGAEPLYLEAAELFLKAHTMCSDIERIEYGIARMYHKAGQCEPAMQWYAKFLGHQQDAQALAEDPNIEALFPKAQGHFKTIEMKCLGADLKVSCETPGTQIVIDEQVAISCPAELRILKGTYRVRAMVEGVEPWEQEIELKPGEAFMVSVPKLEPPPPPPPPGPPWTTLGIAAAGTGAVLGTISLIWFGDLDRRARTRARTAPEVRSEEGAINLVFGLSVGLVLLGAAGIGYDFYLAGEKGSSDPSVSLKVEPGGVRVLGRF